MAGPNSVINTLRDLSLTIDKVTEDLKALWNDQSNIASAASAAAAAAAIAFREAAQSFPSNSAAVWPFPQVPLEQQHQFYHPMQPQFIQELSDGSAMETLVCILLTNF